MINVEKSMSAIDGVNSHSAIPIIADKALNLMIETSSEREIIVAPGIAGEQASVIFLGGSAVVLIGVYVGALSK